MLTRYSVVLFFIALFVAVLPIHGANLDTEGNPILNWETRATQIIESANSVELTLQLPFVDALNEESVDWIIDEASGSVITTNTSVFPGLIRWVIVPPNGNLSVNLEVRETTETHQYLSDAQVSRLHLQTSMRRDSDGSSDRAKLGTPRVFRGVRIAPLYLNPYRFEGEKIVQDWRLSVSITADEQTGQNELWNSRSELLTPPLARALSTMVLNPSHIDTRRDDYADGYSRMMIVYNENIDNEETLDLIMEFADWKQRCGLVVDLVAYDYNGGDYNDAVDDIKEIASQLLNATPPLEFLTIIGDDTTMLTNSGMVLDDVEADLVIPCYQHRIAVGENEYRDLPLDHYFSVYNDEDDLFMPNIKVGRFASPRYDMLNGALLRSMEYERDPFAGPDGEEGEWFTRGLLSIENDRDSGLPDKRRYDLQRWVHRKLIAADFDDVSENWSVSDEDGLPYYADLKDANREVLENGVSVAFADGWLIGCVDIPEDYREDPDTYDWSLEEPWVFANSQRMNPFVLAQGLYYDNITFTYSSYGFFNGGTVDNLIGPATTLGSYYGPLHSPTYHSYGAAAQAFAVDGITTPGDLQIISKLHLLARLEPWLEISDEYIFRYTYNLLTMRQLGDPSMDIYTAEPEQFTVAHPEVYQYGQNGLSYQVNDSDDSPVAGAIVCVRQVGEDDDWQLVTYTDAGGNARFTMPDGLSTDDLQITIRKHNYRPYIADVPVEMPQGTIILSDWSIDDSEGDDDGLLRNGESALLSLALENIGEGDFGDVTLQFSTNSDKFTVDPEEVNIEGIGAGDTYNLEDEITLTLAPNTLGGSELRF
ncbi:C25 family cysteine peptidase, partial [Calditrichota bacterium]